MSDLIDRQAAIDALADYIHNVDRVVGTGHLSADDCKDAAISVLADLPSAQRTGRWIPVAGRMGKETQCDCCGEVFWYWLTNFTYCPNCGAKMEVEAEHD